MGTTFRSLPTDDVRKILLVTTFRSGSTFVGELLSATPGTFFSFEPLSILEDVMDNTRPRVEGGEALRLLQKVFSCNMPQLFADEARKHQVRLM